MKQKTILRTFKKLINSNIPEDGIIAIELLDNSSDPTEAFEALKESKRQDLFYRTKLKFERVGIHTQIIDFYE